VRVTPLAAAGQHGDGEPVDCWLPSAVAVIGSWGAPRASVAVALVFVFDSDGGVNAY